MVAPYTGAWIEITIYRIEWTARSVAPYTGAWIEIAFKNAAALGYFGRPLYGGVD